MKRFEEYKQDVILAYEKKKNEGTLPPNLQRHTPAKLKRECLDEFSNRYLDKDSPTFASLLSRANSAGEYFKMIEASDPDIFRPLNNFLHRKTGGTRDTNIELLAWLIDFEQRPHRPVDFYNVGEPEWDISTTQSELATAEIEDPRAESVAEELIETETINESDESGNIEEEEEVQEMSVIITDDIQNSNNQNFGVPRKFNKTILSFFAAFVILSGSYIFYDKSKQQCMYWDNDHYQSIACDKKVDGATVIAVDTARLSHLKKITHLSSITINDIGRSTIQRWVAK